MKQILSKFWIKLPNCWSYYHDIGMITYRIHYIWVGTKFKGFKLDIWKIKA